MSSSVQPLRKWFKPSAALLAVFGYLVLPYGTSHMSMRLWRFLIWTVADGNFFYGYLPLIGCVIVIACGFLRVTRWYWVLLIVGLASMILPVAVDMLR